MNIKKLNIKEINNYMAESYNNYVYLIHKDLKRSLHPHEEEKFSIKLVCFDPEYECYEVQIEIDSRYYDSNYADIINLDFSNIDLYDCISNGYVDEYYFCFEKEDMINLINELKRRDDWYWVKTTETEERKRVYKKIKNHATAKAVSHTEEMSRQYKIEIEKAIKNTITYNPNFVSKKNKSCQMSISLVDLTSTEAVIKYSGKEHGKVALLNFASYTHPGGGYIVGSHAQEEILCEHSYLYNVLSSFKDSFYKWNNKFKNNSLYLNRALYSPDILFSEVDTINVKAGSVYCDVITCASPNKKAAQNNKKYKKEDNTEALEERIKFILDIAKDNNVDTLILGAFGCGAFGQDPKEVANIFKRYLSTTHKCFKKVIFAIPKCYGKTNYEVFKKILM